MILADVDSQVPAKLMKIANVWIISPFSDPTNPESTDRYRFICQELTDKGVRVCQFISAFDHALKKKRKVPPLTPWRCVNVFEPGYKNNVSAGRILSHLVFDCAIFFYFIRECFKSGIPDTIFMVLPHNGAACIAIIFGKVLGAQVIIDVHDTWPESILSVTKLNFLTKSGYRIWKLSADFPLRQADYVFSESDQYANRANLVRRMGEKSQAKAIYLGGDPDFYRGIQPAVDLPEDLKKAKFIVAYGGTLGANYDLDCLIDAFICFEKECPDAGLILLGGGEREADIRNRIASLPIKAWVSGRLPYRELISYLKCSHVGLNCFKAGGNVAYSYKVNDYFLLGLPVINSLEGEVADLISSQDLGVNYQAGNTISLLNALRDCYLHFTESGIAWTNRIRAFSSQKLNRNLIYMPLIERCLASKMQK
jgi:glycosyltransferase involved in cell wall biosynthesis